jgi:hypothetical protein
MQTIRVKNASILANLNGREIDFEIRTTKDSAQGFALLVDGLTWIEVDATDSGLLCDTRKEFTYKAEPLFSIKMIKTNGCLGQGETQLMKQHLNL